MNFLNILLSAVFVLWILRILVNLVSYIELWWAKEYRFDRMLIHLRTSQGKKILFPAWRRPPITPKAISLLVCSVLTMSGLFYLLQLPLAGKLIIMDLAAFPITCFWVGLLTFPTAIYHEVLISKAVRRLRAHKSMLVVGITGSFGKTSTKEYLAAILGRQYKVLKTEASKNSAIGIAEVILGKLQPEHEVFVVEMGAYKKGEIARMTRMVCPEIGIITAVNPQHQDLFGSLENTMSAKYELIEGLVGKKIAIFNADNELVCEMADRAKKDVREIWFWSSKIQNEKIFTAKEIKTGLGGVDFVCQFGHKSVKVKASVLGEHQVSNILAATAGAVACGMTLPEAASAASLIRPTAKVMEITGGINRSMFLNDTFNNNPDAAKAAIDFMVKARGRKILVFQPMIELGKYAEASHEEVGEYAGRSCDDIILTNSNWYEHFLQGVRKASSSLPVVVLSPKKANEYIRKKVKSGDMVVFKGKEAERILQYCKDN
ncbi:UDP-N-acetylmuramoyl-tripeptide--D-alanyl-D-alanine ligase [Patescibacteria group bacterium]|nr:UDP-N-acetylmuramoyl-tripeptide--D-alanyl-D-alanine ligase [Patescibacteria group bacterium]MBU1472787.1 UDP-N-acetylmuramoyl-tripeptide--D-alanyl-D-alanine ligase [Patescibacteria group bacterium]MBU2459738.1 UDP-N-acetylmuramoyl-tripeptide--D-alanyl-D-alanine ligase [Patescibacteria group bacterium]